VVSRIKRKGIGRLQRSEVIAGYTFITPWIIGMLAFTLIPVIYALVLSFMKWNVFGSPTYIGLANYKKMFTTDPLFWKSLWNTFYMTIFGVPLQLLTALAIASLLNMDVKGLSFYRAIYYIPSIVPLVASAILWLWILSPDFGILNAALRLIGIRGPKWIASAEWSKPSLILMMMWSSGGTMIIYLAGLKGISRQYYEAADIDGATWWAKFVHITLPLLTPTLFFTAVMGVIFTMQIFTQAYVMTQGGPLDSTMFYVYHLFNNAFAFYKMGYASALAWVLLIIILILTIIQFTMSRYWVYYEAGGERR